MTAWPGADEPGGAVATSAAGSLGGLVRTQDGEPVAGAFVTTEPGGVEAVTDAEGRYAIPRLAPGLYRVVAAAEGASASSPEVEVVREGAATADVVWAPAVSTLGTLSVTVVGPDGGPAEGALVQVGAEPAVAVDADGTVELCCFAGQTVDVVVSHPEGRWWERRVEGVAVPAGGNLALDLTVAGRAEDGTVYTGSTVCSYCHTATAAEWSATAHASSLSAVEGAPALGFDDGQLVDLGGPVATLGWDGATPVVELRDVDGATDVWAVAGFIGGEARGAVPWAERDGRAWPLPVAWVPPEDGHEDWAPGGWTVGDTDPWFDASGRFLYSTAPAASASAEAVCFGCHATGYTLGEADGAVSMVAATRSIGRWDEGAVGCEACHGPGNDHSSNGAVGMPDRITNPADLDADRANDVCGQCHGALDGAEGTPYPWSATHERFRPGQRLDELVSSAFVAWPNGTAAIPDAMHDELAGSGHGTGAWSARCTDCHDPHGSALPSDLRVEHEDNTLCASCHTALTFGGDDEALEAHTQHVYQPTSPTETGRCTGCHMPGTATRLSWSADSAAGDLASHRFVTVPPADSVAAFASAGADSLPPGSFPVNGCQECHAWNEWYFGGDNFPGPAGDMTLRATHEVLSTSFVEKYP